MAMATIILMASVFSGCVKEEEIPMEATRQLVIPPELEPEAALPGFDGEIFYECGYEGGRELGNDVETKTKVCVNYIREFVNGRLGKDFIKGYLRTYSIYTLKSGEEIGIAYPLLRIFVLKYKNAQATEQAFSLDTEFMELKDLVLDGVKVKWHNNTNEPIVYMLQSNNFIVYIDGSDEPCTDAVSRIIELYSVPISKDY